MTDKEKAVIIIDLIEKITQEIIDKPLHRKKYLQMRGHLEKAVAKPFEPETSGDVLADNSPEPTRKGKKK